MNKAQILILLVLIALAVYYFSQEKSTQKSSSLPSKPPAQTNRTLKKLKLWITQK